MEQIDSEFSRHLGSVRKLRGIHRILDDTVKVLTNAQFADVCIMLHSHAMSKML